jgi:hypothetical protein
MGTNLGFFASYAEWALVDVFKMSSPWVSGVPWTPGGPPYQWDDGRPLDVDAQGWVRSLLPGQVARTTILWGPLPIRPGGRYLVLYEGEGSLAYSGGATRLVSSAPGRDVLEVDATAGIELDIVAVNPENYVRNIRVIMPGGIYASDPYTLVLEPDPARTDYLSFEEHYPEILFHPDFLASLRGFAAVRFMNWQHPNDSTEVSWADRPHLDDARWTTQGVPLEILIELANRVGFDPWFNLSYRADDDYFHQAATLIHSRLNPTLTPYIEYSNEVGNTAFPQHAYLRSRGLSLGLDPDGYRAAWRYYTLRATQLFTLFETVYGDPDRFTAVLGSSAAEPWVTQLVLDYPDTRAHTDLVAIDGYFGLEANWDGNCNRIAAMTLDQFFNYLATESLPLALQRTQAHTAITQAHNIPLAFYEGGQHLTVNDCAGNTAKRQTIETLFDQANRDPRIKDIYLTHFTNTWQAGTTLFMHYVNTDKWTGDSRFGSRQHLNQTRQQAPKYDAIQTILQQQTEADDG